ncbi:MAG: Holliday junction branch migration protein RuvA [Rhodospirillaceae bacterium]|nr:MAG: Holliday junction branch migration protein RuvA [Rhodospirillaceae bacterium]
MIAKLRGRVDSIGDGEAVIDVGGVGYLVFAPARTLADLAVGQAADLAVETHVREDHIHLYGFSTAADRQMFRTLTTVQGVGAKVGLAILSVLSADEAARAVAAGDYAPFRRAAGVGPKLAQRIVAELKDRLPGFAAPLAAPTGRGDSPAPAGRLVDDAVSALVNLGYGRTEAFTVVSRTAHQLGESTPIAQLIGAALRELGGQEGGARG